MRTEKWPVTVSFHQELYGAVESMAAKEQRKLAAMVKILVAEAIAARSNIDTTGVFSPHVF